MRQNRGLDYLEDLESGQATNWAGTFFYKHMFDVWTDQKEALKQMNNYSLDKFERLMHFEFYYDLSQVMRDMIQPQLDSEDAEPLTELFKQIQEITGGAEFSQIEQQDYGKIKVLLSKIRQLIWRYMFKYGMIMPAKKETEDPKQILG